MARILVIDDDRLVRDTLKSFLQVEGHTVLLAVDGDDGLRQCREQVVDLVICDIFMPGKEGIETVREMRPTMPTVPIVTMTVERGSFVVRATAAKRTICSCRASSAPPQPSPSRSGLAGRSP